MLQKINYILAAIVAFSGAMWFILSPYVEQGASITSNPMVEATTTPTQLQTPLSQVAIPIEELKRPIISRTGTFVEVTDSCGHAFDDACVHLRSGPGTTFQSVMRLRKGVVLEINKTEKVEGTTWYRIKRDSWLRYPERASGSWYISADYVRVFKETSADAHVASAAAALTNKRIIIDRSDQMMYAYEGEELFMKENVSTGIKVTPTPRGTFTVYKKTPSRYMQGPLPGISEKYYDLPGVPWNLYFTYEGAVIHGAFWHNSFGKPYSNGCVNLPLSSARILYEWAPVGTKVTVRD